MIALVDSHSHLDAEEFDPDRRAVLERARAAGVDWQIIPAVSVRGFEKLAALCVAEAGLFPAYGLHPMHVGDHRPEDIGTLATWLERERPVAVGECGLDRYVDGLDTDLQRHYFRRQLELAREFALPVVIHARRAVEDVIVAIRTIGGLTGVVHSFSGSPEQARQLWNLGFLIGLGGPVTHERAHRLRRLAASMPIDFLLLETDSPDQPSAGHRGERNEPAHLVDVLHAIAALRGADPASIAAATTRNAGRLFGIPCTG